MKRDKDFNQTVRRRSNFEIPSWVVFSVIMTGTFAVCVAVTLRTHSARLSAEERYHQVKSQLRNQNESNATLAAGIHHIRRGGTITVIELQPDVNSAELVTESPIPEQQLPSPLTVFISYAGAIVSGFTTVKLLIALLRTKFRRRRHLRNESTQTKVSSAVALERDPRAARRQALLLAGCLVLAVGFLYAVRQQILAVDYGYKTEALRREREELLDEQRRLKLALEEISSPARLEEAGRTSGTLSISNSQKQSNNLANLGTLAEPATLDANKTSPSGSSVSSDFFTLLSTSVSWVKFVLLALFGGLIAVLSSGVLTRIGRDSLVIGHAPGGLFHSAVDFLYSPKTVKETFEPIIADWRLEYFEALSQKRIWKARWICVRYYYHFIKAMGLSKLFSFFKVFSRAGK